MTEGNGRTRGVNRNKEEETGVRVIVRGLVGRNGRARDSGKELPPIGTEFTGWTDIDITGQGWTVTSV